MATAEQTTSGFIQSGGQASPELIAATRFLQAHYCSDDLDADQVRRDMEHWERVAGDAARFPNADLDFIEEFTVAALDWLVCGQGDAAVISDALRRSA